MDNKINNISFGARVKFSTNDNLKNISHMSTLKTVEKVQILKYHSMGKYKWEKLGQKYELEGVRDATLEDEERAKKILGIE